MFRLVTGETWGQSLLQDIDSLSAADRSRQCIELPTVSADITDRQADEKKVGEPQAKLFIEMEDCQSLSCAEEWWSAWRLDERLAPLDPQDPVHVYYQRLESNG